jgi:fatty acid amide hydrolase 2
LNSIAAYKIREIRELVKSKKLSPVEILRIYRRQADLANYHIRALVADRFDQAFIEAKDMEEKIMKGGDVPLLAGLPFTCKEMIEAENMPLTVGLVKRKGMISKSDAPVVSKLRSLGGNFIGVTNVPELGFWFETDNYVYGRTNNPYDLQRTPGGSSGGEAAIIAAAGSAFGIGSDVGGSIRIPAMFCGIFGHKPTRGTIPFTGHYPMTTEHAALYQGSSHRITTMGPMARSAEDLIEIFKHLAFQDGIDSEVVDHHYSWQPINWKNRKVYTLKAPDFNWAMPVDEEAKSAVRRATQFFHDQGAIIEELPSDIFKDGVALWYEELATVIGPSFCESLGMGEGIDLPRELVKILAGKAEYTVPNLINVAMEKVFNLVKPMVMKKNNDRVLQRRKKLNEILGDQSILILPTHPRPAFFHHSGKLRPYDFVYTAIFNALDLPATQVPMGFTVDSLPIGVQVVASQGRDDVALLAANDLDKGFGGWRPSGLFM